MIDWLLFKVAPEGNAPFGAPLCNELPLSVVNYAVALAPALAPALCTGAGVKDPDEAIHVSGGCVPSILW